MSIAAFREEFRYRIMVLPVASILYFKIIFLSLCRKQPAHMVLNSIRIDVVCKYNRNQA